MKKEARHILPSDKILAYPSQSPFQKTDHSRALGRYGRCVVIYPPGEEDTFGIEASTHGMGDYPSIERLGSGKYPGFLTEAEYDLAFADASIIAFLVTPSCFQGDRFLYQGVYDYCAEHDIALLPFTYDSEYCIARYNELFPNEHILKLDSRVADLTNRQKVRSFIANHYLTLFPESDYAKVASSFAKRAFLSYRKINRPQVDDVLDLFKEDEDTRHCLVWFDEMLTPGEIYAEEIEAAIDDADAVVFLVSQEIFEEGNYVRDIEFPYTKRKKKPMIALCFEDIDELRLRQYFPGMPRPINVIKEKGKAMQGLIRLFRDPDWKATPENCFYMGFAYMQGFLVRKDDDIAYDYFTDSWKGGYDRALLAEAELLNGTVPDHKYYDTKSANTLRLGFRGRMGKRPLEESMAVLSHGNPNHILGGPRLTGGGRHIDDVYHEAFLSLFREKGATPITPEKDSFHHDYIEALSLLLNEQYEKAFPYFQGFFAQKNELEIEPAEKAMLYYHCALAYAARGEDPSPIKEAFNPEYSFSIRPSMTAIPALDLYDAIAQAYNRAKDLRVYQTQGKKFDSFRDNTIDSVRDLTRYRHYSLRVRLEITREIVSYALFAQNKITAKEIVEDIKGLLSEAKETNDFAALYEALETYVPDIEALAKEEEE